MKASPFDRARLLALLVVLGSSGCATVRPDAKAAYFGAVDAKRDRIATANANASAATDDAPEVEVVRGKVPDGLDLADGGKALVVAPGHEARFAVLGEVTADYANARRALFVNNFIGSWDYDQGWRKALCHTQVPLKVVTFGLWAYLSPTHYPCFATLPGNEDDRTEALLLRMRQGAHAMGANLVVVTEEEGSVMVDRSTGRQIGGETRALGLRGFAVKKTVAAEPASRVDAVARNRSHPAATFGTLAAWP